MKAILTIVIWLGSGSDTVITSQSYQMTDTGSCTIEAMIQESALEERLSKLDSRRVAVMAYCVTVKP